MGLRRKTIVFSLGYHERMLWKRMMLGGLIMRVMTNHQQSIDAGVLLYQNTLGYTICSITCTVFRTIIRHAQKGKRNSKSTSIVADKTLHMHESSGRFIFYSGTSL